MWTVPLQCIPSQSIVPRVVKNVFQHSCNKQVIYAEAHNILSHLSRNLSMCKWFSNTLPAQKELKWNGMKSEWGKHVEWNKVGRSVQMCKLIWLIKVDEKRKHDGIHYCNSQILFHIFNGSVRRSIARHGTARYGTNILYVAWPETEIRITVTKL